MTHFLTGFADELVKVAWVGAVTKRLRATQDRDLLRRRDELLGGRQAARREDADLLRRRDELLGGRRTSTQGPRMAAAGKTIPTRSGAGEDDDLLARRDALLMNRRPAPAVAKAPQRMEFSESEVPRITPRKPEKRIAAAPARVRLSEPSVAQYAAPKPSGPASARPMGASVAAKTPADSLAKVGGVAVSVDELVRMSKPNRLKQGALLGLLGLAGASMLGSRQKNKTAPTTTAKVGTPPPSGLRPVGPRLAAVTPRTRNP